MIEDKLHKFKALFKNGDKVTLAFSGGVDSTLLLYLIKHETNASLRAVTVKTPYIPEWELTEAVEICRETDTEHTIIRLDIPQILINNPVDRCYICKKQLFARIIDEASKQGSGIIVDGTNSDDTGLHRPGLRALEELKVMSPLKESGFTKKEIRELLRKYRPEMAEKPAYSCLMTRLPYNTRITREVLEIIEKGEQYIHSLGFSGTRLRMHGDIARIETSLDNFPKIITESVRKSITEKLSSMGIRYITIDLEGYRSGSMDR
jgi:uncharacterized protein